MLFKHHSYLFLVLIMLWPAVLLANSCPVERSICLSAQNSGKLDIASNMAEVSGEVEGFLRDWRLDFSSEIARLYQYEQNWKRIVFPEKVAFNFADGSGEADHAAIDKLRWVLIGNVSWQEPGLTLKAHEVIGEDEGAMFFVRGNEQPLEFETGAEAILIEEAQQTQASATRATIDKELKTITLLGEAWLTQGPASLSAQQIILIMDSDNKVQSFKAIGNVHLIRPQQWFRAAVANSKQQPIGKTIELLGNATGNIDGQDVQSERLEVFLDPEQGLVEVGSSTQSPLKVKIGVNVSPKERYVFDVQRLVDKLRPQLVAKLIHIDYSIYDSLDAFEEQLEAILTPLDFHLHKELIIKQGLHKDE